MSSTLEVFNIISVIIQIILFVVGIVLILGLTKYLKGLMTKVEDVQKDLNNFKIKLEPLIDDSLQLVKKLNVISDKVEDNIDVVKTTVLKIKDATDKVIEFEQNLQNKIEIPVLDTINTYTAIVKGVKTFFDKLRTGKKDVPAPIAVRNKIDEDDMIFDTGDKTFDNNSIEEEFNDINKELNDVRKKLEEMKKV
jgi:hypothetical protein